MNQSVSSDNKRTIIRLQRQPDHHWQLRVDGDRLITKNIINLSPKGMAFKAPASTGLELGGLHRFSISLKSGEDFEVEGRVLWSRPAEGAGAMMQFGVEFSRLPPLLDTYIMKEINDQSLRYRREAVTLGQKPSFFNSRPLLVSSKLRRLLMRIIGLGIVLLLTSAFLTAMWIYEETHPQHSIARKFNDSLIRKISGVDQDYDSNKP